VGRQHGSSNWLKVQKHTPDKPEIRHMARRCGCSIGEAFLAWFRVYTYFDETTEDGDVPFFTPDDVDDIGKLPGLGNSMAEVGWVLFDAGGCTVVKWERHNGASAKRRAVEAERQARIRDAGRTHPLPPPSRSERDTRTRSVHIPSPNDRDALRTTFVTEQSRGIHHEE